MYSDKINITPAQANYTRPIASQLPVVIRTNTAISENSITCPHQAGLLFIGSETSICGLMSGGRPTLPDGLRESVPQLCPVLRARKHIFRLKWFWEISSPAPVCGCRTSGGVRGVNSFSLCRATAWKFADIFILRGLLRACAAYTSSRSSHSPIVLFCKYCGVCTIATLKGYQQLFGVLEIYGVDLPVSYLGRRYGLHSVHSVSGVYCPHRCDARLLLLFKMPPMRFYREFQIRLEFDF